MHEIEFVQIETTNACPNKCKFCPHGLIEGTKVMTMELFKKIIDEAAELGIEKIVPFQNGEPFADEFIFDRLDYIKEKMPKAKLDIFTNGALLNKEKIDKLNDYNIELINFSINAACEETYKAVCGTDNYQTVMDNALYAAGNLKKRVRVSIVPCPEAVDDVPKFKTYWSNFPVEVQVNEYFNWSGKIWPEKETILQPCFRILRHLNVQADGKVIWCCMDIGEKIIGDLTKESIHDVWEKSEWRRIMHKHGKRFCLEPCFKCQNRT